MATHQCWQKDWRRSSREGKGRMEMERREEGAWRREG